MAYGIVMGSGTLGGGSSAADISEHNSDAKAHPSILSAISDLKDRVLAVEIAAGAEVTANPFAVTFGNLDGVTANGIWNASSSRLEF